MRLNIQLTVVNMFLETNDKVEIAYNKIIFLKKKQFVETKLFKNNLFGIDKNNFE